MRAAARLSVVMVALGAALATAPARAQNWDQNATNWAGFYVGGNLGASFDNSNLSIRDLSVEQDLSGPFVSSDDQFIGGVHLGYNLQGANILYGIEGDADFGADINFLGSIRGRLGWAGSRVLVYGTLGVAFVNEDRSFTIISADDGPFNLSSSLDAWGLVAGGGIDFKIMPRLSLGAEGLYYNLSNDGARLIAGDEPFILHDHPAMTVVRGRITYYFNTGY